LSLHTFLAEPRPFLSKSFFQSPVCSRWWPLQDPFLVHRLFFMGDKSSPYPFVDGIITGNPPPFAVTFWNHVVMKASFLRSLRPPVLYDQDPPVASCRYHLSSLPPVIQGSTRARQTPTRPQDRMPHPLLAQVFSVPPFPIKNPRSSKFTSRTTLKTCPHDQFYLSALKLRAVQCSRRLPLFIAPNLLILVGVAHPVPSSDLPRGKLVVPAVRPSRALSRVFPPLPFFFRNIHPLSPKCPCKTRPEACPTPSLPISCRQMKVLVQTFCPAVPWRSIDFPKVELRLPALGNLKFYLDLFVGDPLDCGFACLLKC